MTAEQLLDTSVPNKRTELVRGRLIVHEPPGGLHGHITAILGVRLGQHIDLTDAGALFVGDTGFTLSRNPDTVRGPDIAFVCKERVPSPIPSSFLEFAPDLVVEVLSHHDRPGEVLAKVGDWLDAGTRLVWVIDPERRVARIYREDVLPGLSIMLASILG
jgi:Uma2 family endonuclease